MGYFEIFRIIYEPKMILVISGFIFIIFLSIPINLQNSDIGTILGSLASLLAIITAFTLIAVQLS